MLVKLTMCVCVLVWRLRMSGVSHVAFLIDVGAPPWVQPPPVYVSRLSRAGFGLRAVRRVLPEKPLPGRWKPGNFEREVR